MILSVDLDVPDENLVEFTNQLIQAVALAFQVRIGNEWQGVHGCDGCCTAPHAAPTSPDSDEEQAHE